LDTYLPLGGLIAVTNKSLTFGRKDEAITNYSLHGSLDEVRIYDQALAPNEIETLMTLWHTDEVTSIPNENGKNVFVYPNPSSGTIFISNFKNQVRDVAMMDSMGGNIKCSYSTLAENIFRIEYGNAGFGLLILKVMTDRGMFYFKVLAE
jgi:hypothetical protein